MTNVYLDASDMVKNMTELDHLVTLETDIAGDHIVEDSENKTFPYVPLKEGYLQDGFYTKEVSQPPILQIDMYYSSVANNYYDYAARQHEEILNHPLKGTDHYMIKGLSHVNAEALYAYHVSKVL